MTNQYELKEWLEIATEGARKGGEVLKKFWGNLHVIKEKNFPGDLVTEADQQSEGMIIEWISKHFPTHQILAEESGLTHSKSDYIWAIDPLDGTVNFAHQYPMVAVSIGLIYKHEPILGVIFNPILNELFQGAKGVGAFLNHSKIKSSSTKNLKDALLATGFAYDRRETTDNNYAEFSHFTHLTQGVRRGGAASLDLAYVACGRLDGYWERGLKPWDMAAGAIIVREAGGFISDYQLDPFQLESGRILATNGSLQNAMSQELTHVKSLRLLFNHLKN